MLLADDFLQDDAHLLLIDDIGRGCHVSLRVAIVDAGINGFDGIGEHVQLLVFIRHMRNHIGGVDAGEGLVVAVLEQRTGTDSDWCLHDVEEGHEVANEACGQASIEEVGEDILVGDIAERHLIKLVGIHELIKDVGAKHDSLGYHHLSVVVFVEVGVALDDMVDEGYAASLATQRAIADAGKIGVSVETFAVEHGHDALVLHATIGDDGVENDLAMLVDVLQRVPSDAFEEVGDGEKGTRAEPTRDVVVLHMVKQRLARQGKDIVLKVFEVAQTCHLLQGLRVAEHEITEAEVAEDELAQIHSHLLGILVDEAHLLALHELRLLGLGALHDEGHELITLADSIEQPHTS